MFCNRLIQQWQNSKLLKTQKKMEWHYLHDKTTNSVHLLEGKWHDIVRKSPDLERYLSLSEALLYWSVKQILFCRIINWNILCYRLPEFKFWYSATKATVIAFVCTFFDFFNIPVFWPILVMYFITLFCITMKRQIKVINYFILILSLY